MSIVKKTQAVVLSAALGFCLLTGCAKAPEKEPAKAPADTAAAQTQEQASKGTEGGDVAAGETVTVTLAIGGVSAEELEMRNDQIKIMNEKYPHINLVIQTVVGDYMQWLQTSIASGTTPDIVSLGTETVNMCLDAGLLEPLNSYIEKYGTDIEDFEETILSNYTFDGEVYGLPKDFNTLVMFYNEDMLKAAGIDQAPAVWDEVTAAAEAVTKDGVVGLCLSDDVARFDPFIRMAGGRFTDENGVPTFTAEGNAEGLGFYYSFIQNGTGKSPAELGVGWNAEAFAQGKAAMIFEGGWAVPFLNTTAPDLNWKMAPLPAGPKSQDTLVFDGVYCVTADSKVKDAAFQVIEFLSGPEAQQLMVDTGLAIPTRKSINKNYTEKFPERAALIESVSFAHPWYYGDYTVSITAAMNHVGEALSTGTIKDPAEALATYEAEVDTE